MSANLKTTSYGLGQPHVPCVSFWGKIKIFRSYLGKIERRKVCKTSIIIIFGLIVGLNNILHPQSDNIRFERISLEHGLSESVVTGILKDHLGFMWFSTVDGLNKYDGNKFTIYKHDFENPHSLSVNFISTIYKDQSGTIWIGTSEGGLDRFDNKHERFNHFKHDPNNPNSLSSNSIRSICEDNSGIMWIGTANGLNKFDRVTEHFTIYHHSPDNINSLSNNDVRHIYLDRSGILWIATANGLNKFDRDSEQFACYKPIPKNKNNTNSDYITSIFEDRSSNLWIGTNGGGVFKFNRKNNTFTHHKNNSNNPNYLTKDIINFIFEDQFRELWIGTKGGLHKFDPDKETYTYYIADSKDKRSLSHNIAQSIYEDESGILWIGTHGGGINKYDRKKERFTTINNPRDVFAIVEDKSNALWIGADYGLYKFDKKRKLIRHFLNDPIDRNSLSDNHVSAIHVDELNNLWIGTLGGLDYFNQKENKFTSFKHNPKNPYSISSNSVHSILEDRYGIIWFGTGDGGLNRYDKENKKFVCYKHTPGDPSSLSNNTIWSLLEDRSGNLWIATHRGLNRFNRKTETFESFLHDEDNSKSISHSSILSLYEDQTGALWIGTFGGGLNKLVIDVNSTTFTHYSEKNGLANDAVWSILGDHSGNIWLSTNKGISKFNPKTTENFKNFDVEDGLQSNEFNVDAQYQMGSGEMFFGGIQGITSFYPDSVVDNPHVPPVVITDFQIFNESVSIGANSPLHQHIAETKELILSYKDNVFSFQFAAMDFSIPEKNQYAFMMDGFEDDWNYVGTKRSATYTNLDPGEYTFRVKASNNDGLWNEEGTSIRIVITPPWWQTWWLRTLAILSVLLTAYTWYNRRINKLEAKKKELEERVNERTEAAHKLQNALDQVEQLKNQLQAENVYLQDEIKIAHNFEYIISRSEALKRVLSNVEKVASTDATVLILGESGTGKELVARAVHNISNRANRPLVKVNCSALPENLIESELFGHEKGAFTGAISQKIGRFELANEGTIFLDEIGDLPYELQTKLLRVLQEGEFERIGNPQTIKVDVRVIAATNRNLEEAITNGDFREDLYYRLNVFPIIIPPLRERKEDIPLLVKHFMEKYSAKAGKQVEMVSQNLIDKLQSYNWPGNVRELENIIERAVIITQGKKLMLGDWLPTTEPRSEDSDIPTLEELEKKHILEVLELTDWRIRGENGAAKILNLKPTTLASRMAKLGIKRNH